MNYKILRKMTSGAEARVCRGSFGTAKAVPSPTTALFSLAIMVAFGLSSCSSERQQTTPSPETVRNVSVVAVQSSNVPDLLEAVGTVRAAQTSDLASQAMGNIVEVRVREGDRIQRGQVLAVILRARVVRDRVRIGHPVDHPVNGVRLAVAAGMLVLTAIAVLIRALARRKRT